MMLSSLPSIPASPHTGFVLGKPFWASPTISPVQVRKYRPSNEEGVAGAPRGTLTQQEADSPTDAVLHPELGNTILSIKGMDGYFTYDFVYKQVGFGA